MCSRIALFAIAIALVACDKGDGKKTGTGSGSAAVTAPPVAKGVQIFVDDQPVATVKDSQINAWPRLDTLIPAADQRMGTWETLCWAAVPAKPTEINRPSSTHPDLIPALFPGEGGTASFGLFDPVELAKHGKRRSARIVRTRSGSSSPRDPATARTITRAARSRIRRSSSS